MIVNILVILLGILWIVAAIAYDLHKTEVNYWLRERIRLGE
jgi:hypothetical protein